MKKVKKLFTALTLLIASKDVASTALHTTVNFPIKSKSADNTAAFNKLKTAPYHFTKTAGANNYIDTSSNPVDIKSLNSPGRLRRQANKIRDYAKANNYSMEYCFLVDMSMH